MIVLQFIAVSEWPRFGFPPAIRVAQGCFQGGPTGGTITAASPTR